MAAHRARAPPILTYNVADLVCLFVRLESGFGHPYPSSPVHTRLRPAFNCRADDRARSPTNRGHDDLVRIAIDEHTKRFRFEFQRLKYEYFPADKLQVRPDRLRTLLC